MSKNKSPAEHVDEKVTAAEEVAVETAVTEDENNFANLTPEELVAKCTELQQRANENWEKLLRLQAEMENVRRRAERDIVSAHKYGLEKLIKAWEAQEVKDRFVYDAFEYNAEEWDNVPPVIPRFQFYVQNCLQQTIEFTKEVYER